MSGPPPMPRAVFLAALFRRARGFTPPRRVWGYHSGTGRGGEIDERGEVVRNQWATLPMPKGERVTWACVEGTPDEPGEWVRLPTE